MKRYFGGRAARVRDLAHQYVGEVVWASVRNPLENPHSGGKHRPVVLVSRTGGHWLTMGLTTRPRYQNGAARHALPDPRANGLHRPGYLWGDRLTRVSVLDLGDHIGWADPSLTDLIICATHISVTIAGPLREAALLHHPDPPPRADAA